MADVIIRKKDVEQLGKEVIKEVYDFLHDEYINTFPEMKEEKRNFLKNLVIGKFENVKYTIVEEENSWKIEYEEIDENKFKDELKCLKDEIKNGSIDTKIIFRTVKDLNFDNQELHEDLYAKASAFKNIFLVYNYDYSYLED